MKQYFIYIIICFTSILTACEKDTAISEELIAPEYTLPQGKPGSIDEKIYQIHQKYGTYILYSFDKNDFKRLWTTKWNKWYVPANTNDDLKYVERFVDFIDANLLSKFDVEFIRNNFPYKVFLVDSLCDNSTYNKRKLVNVLSNGNNALAVSNVGKACDEWKEKDWKQLEIDLNNAFSLYYYSSLTEKPIKFISLRSRDISLLSDPQDIDTKYNYSCWTAGYVAGWLNTYLPPKEEQDFADFVRFVTGTTGKELERIMTRFPRMKERAAVLYTYLKNKMNMDMIATQNSNFPEDKLSFNYFN